MQFVLETPADPLNAYAGCVCVRSLVFLVLSGPNKVLQLEFDPAAQAFVTRGSSTIAPQLVGSLNGALFSLFDRQLVMLLNVFNQLALYELGADNSSILSTYSLLTLQNYSGSNISAFAVSANSRFMFLGDSQRVYIANPGNSSRYLRHTTRARKRRLVSPGREGPRNRVERLRMVHGPPPRLGCRFILGNLLKLYRGHRYFWQQIILAILCYIR